MAQKELRFSDSVTVDAFSDATGLPQVLSTLVVAPVSMLGQWRREILAYTAGAARVRLHYGTERVRRARDLAECDFVLTSYGTLAAEYDGLLKAEASMAASADAPLRSISAQSSLSSGLGRIGSGLTAAIPVLFGVHWQRVGLDEAHVYRNRSTKSARACFELSSRHRWALTGTPLQNSLQDLFSLLHFLRAEPWSELRWWKQMIAGACFRCIEPGASHRPLLRRPLRTRRSSSAANAAHCSTSLTSSSNQGHAGCRWLHNR